MGSIAVLRINEKKCGTCRFWNGDRDIEFGGNKPRYVKASALKALCIAQKSKTVTPGNKCPKYQLWEKI